MTEVIPCFWFSRHDEILARGYADQGLLEALLSRSLWRPPGAFRFVHRELRGPWPEVEGAVVIFNGRTHTSAKDVDWIALHLDRLAWSLAVVCGDEEAVFPHFELKQSETRRVWYMQPRPEHEHYGKLPGGWYPGTREGVSAGRVAESAKPYDWAFGGQVTHERRQACAKMLRELPNGFLHETDGYLRGMPQADYWRELANAKIAPCPSGPYTVDTARPLEALEAGCLPVVDMTSIYGPDFDYWSLTFGGDCPFIRIRDWEMFPYVLERELAQWPANVNRSVSHWCGWKRRIAHQLDGDIHRARGTKPDLETPDDQVTVIIPTSPVPLHPSTEHLAETIDSVRESLPLAEIVVVCDGVREEQEHRRDDYEEYQRRLMWDCQHRWRNVVPLRLEAWGHQANAVRAALGLVVTPLVLIVEHDTPLVNDFPWPELCAVVRSGEANVVRFHHESHVLEPHRSVMLDDAPRTIGGVPLWRTSAFWARPHLASTRFYREQIMGRIPTTSRVFLEDFLYPVIARDVADHGESGWFDWRVFQYAPEGNMLRSRHLDSRADEPKYAQRAR